MDKENPISASAASTVLQVPDMCCAAEFNLVEKELRRVDGVHDVTPDFIRRSVRVAHQAVPEPELIAAAARSGFEVRPGRALPQGKGLGAIGIRAANAAPAAPAHADHEHDHAHGHQHEHEEGPGHVHANSTPSWKLIVGGVLALAAELAALAYGDSSASAVALALGAIVLAGLETYRKGLVALRRFNLNINALMTVAVTGAAILGQWPEAAMVIVLFAIAEMIEEKSLDRARRAIEGLMAMAPDMATVQQGATWQAVPAATVAVGAVVRVRPGERVALDGTVTAGSSAVDQAAITGESVPVDKQVGDPLFAGTINQNGELQYTVSARADDSTLARIIRAVQEAQASRAPTQRFVDTFARYYTPAVFAVAVAVAVLPPLLLAGADWLTWVYRALVLLVIACPCALVLSTPISVVSGLTAAARRGILVKGGLHLEQGHRLQVLALDKTGTLTQGRPVLTDVQALQGSEDEVRALAVALSSRSDHPVSRAIAAARGEGALPEVSDFQALQGRGVEGRIDNERYRLGNHRLVEESQACTPALEAQLDALEVQGKTAVVLVRGNVPIGIFAIADQVRPESVEAVAQLKQLGVRPVMLTGDNRHTAEAIARLVGIEDVRSELMPQDKLRAIEELSAGGTVVGMVGDGINDAPALAKAHVGFAMGAAGTDTAIETADVALMDDDPRKLAEFIDLSRATRAVLWQNITLALGIKVVFLALAVAGQATLWMAVFADMGGSLLVVFNGLRLLRHRRR